MLQISLINDNTNINPRHKNKKKKKSKPIQSKVGTSNSTRSES